MSGHTYTHTYTHDNYYNPRCACAPRVNNVIGMVLGNHVIYICSIVLPFVAIKMHLFHYTFTGER